MEEGVHEDLGEELLVLVVCNGGAKIGEKSKEERGQN